MLHKRLIRAIDEEEAAPNGGFMGAKPEGITRICSINKGGFRLKTIKSMIQHAVDVDIDIQCYSENNIDTLKGHVQQRLYEDVHSMDQTAKAI